MKNTMTENLSRKSLYFFHYFSSYEQFEVNAQLPPSPPHKPLDENFWIFTRVVELSGSYGQVHTMYKGRPFCEDGAINGAPSAALSQLIPPLPIL